MAKEDRFAADREWFLDSLRHERGASLHTISAYANDLAAASDFFSGKDVESWQALSESDLLSYQSFAAHQVAASTLRRRMSSLRSFLKFLKKNNRGPAADLPSVTSIKIGKRVPKAMPLDALEKLLDSPDLSTAPGRRDRTLMELVYGTGLRVTEAIELSLSDVSSESGVFRVTGKRGKVRVVPIPRHTLPFVEDYLASTRPMMARAGVGKLFVGDRGRALSRQSAYAIIDKHRRRAGIDAHVSPHTLRHTYAVHLVQGGADLRVVQELLGHASISTTQVYTQLDLKTVKAQYEKAHPRAGKKHKTSEH